MFFVIIVHLLKSAV